MRKIKKGDQVQIMRGAGRGIKGIIAQVIDNKKVIVDGAPCARRHYSPSPQRPDGGIVEIPRAIDISNVMLYEEGTGPTRIKFEITDGKKMRVSKKTGNRYA
jgi:large subunit ribosomal protein L24